MNETLGKTFVVSPVVEGVRIACPTQKMSATPSVLNVQTQINENGMWVFITWSTNASNAFYVVSEYVQSMQNCTRVEGEYSNHTSNEQKNTVFIVAGIIGIIIFMVWISMKIFKRKSIFEESTVEMKKETPKQQFIIEDWEGNLQPDDIHINEPPEYIATVNPIAECQEIEPASQRHAQEDVETFIEIPLYTSEIHEAPHIEPQNVQEEDVYGDDDEIDFFSCSDPTIDEEYRNRRIMKVRQIRRESMDVQHTPRFLDAIKKLNEKGIGETPSLEIV
jgi:hypothetical protein